MSPAEIRTIDGCRISGRIIRKSDKRLGHHSDTLRTRVLETKTFSLSHEKSKKWIKNDMSKID